MSEKRSREIIAYPGSTQGSVLRNLVMRIKLVLRLMADRRVSFVLKLLPIASLIYLFSPIDLAPGITLPIIGALDDAAIVGLGTYLFVELCPPEVVREHLKELTSNLDLNSSETEIVEGETIDRDHS